MSRFERFRSGILPPSRICLSFQLFVSLLLLATCSVHLPGGGAPALTVSPPPATSTPVPLTPTQAATETPAGTTVASPPFGTATMEPTRTGTVTPAEPTPTGTPTPTRPPGLVVNGTGNSNAEQAHLGLQSGAESSDPIYLIIVSGESTGTEGEIYRDLRQRRFRTTTGPDEGIDTSGEFCYPECVYVLSEEINAISINSYMRVLQHEYRHVTQAKNNPSMAHDFRDQNGVFTPYAAFSEACADYGLNVAPVYHAQQRIDRLKSVLGTDWQGMIDQACLGDKAAYQDLVDQYNQEAGQNNAFEQLFPPYP